MTTLTAPAATPAAKALPTLFPTLPAKPARGAADDLALRVDAFRRLCADGVGTWVHLPGDAGYDTARTPWNLTDQRPAAVAVPRDADEVGLVVSAAAAAGLRVAPQSTGHNAGPLAASGLADVVLVRTTALQEVVVDPGRRRARVGGGVEWQAVVEAAAPHGLACLHGSSPNVGVAGYSLGGGIGWYARQLGLATSHLTAVEVVLADGRIVTADAEHHAELFWAVRGGGGNFGVVTALELELFAIPTAYAGMMIFDAGRTREVLTRWSAWAVDAPDEVTTSFRVLHLPPLPELPPFLSGRSVVIVDGAVLADDARAAEVLAPLRDLQPEVDTFGRVPAAALTRLHMDPEDGMPVASDSLMLASLPAEAVEVVTRAATQPGSALMMVELRQLGGALGRHHPGGGAVDRFDGQFLAFAGGLALDAAMGMATQAEALALTGALAPWASGSAYLNFVETEGDASGAFTDATWERLRAVRSVVDPDGLFLANHVVPRLGEGGSTEC
ncbi:FAD-binding oxidoreductase [Microlunatus flavus]|uniref:FAD/FMN-containing dehydrogenase n=1 Tax=Microlunatus flavus TaxID=1036181 RepID=A0A1H9AT32_9ACTN|nr:FAD-binding oxidoreductase [Microlunatus flavus]SEP79934.1 FAD/FMN-containing dehydrogenase [Microlunatus flavus]